MAAFWYGNMLIWQSFSSQLGNPGKSARYSTLTSSTGRPEKWFNASFREKYVPSKGIREPTWAAEIHKDRVPQLTETHFTPNCHPSPNEISKDLICVFLHQLYWALGTEESKHRHHQPHLRNTRDPPVARVWL